MIPPAIAAAGHAIETSLKCAHEFHPVKLIGNDKGMGDVFQAHSAWSMTNLTLKIPGEWHRPRRGQYSVSVTVAH